MTTRPQSGCVSELRCFSGTSVRKNIPSSAPVKTHPNTMHATVSELTIYLQGVERWSDATCLIASGVIE